MESVLSGAADLTEPYWTVSGYYKGRARSEHLELGCTVLGLLRVRVRVRVRGRVRVTLT